MQNNYENFDKKKVHICQQSREGMPLSTYKLIPRTTTRTSTGLEQNQNSSSQTWVFKHLINRQRRTDLSIP